MDIKSSKLEIAIVFVIDFYVPDLSDTYLQYTEAVASQVCCAPSLLLSLQIRSFLSACTNLRINFRKLGPVFRCFVDLCKP